MDKFNDYVNEDIRPNSKVEFEEDWVYNTFTVCTFGMTDVKNFCRGGPGFESHKGQTIFSCALFLFVTALML